MLRDIFHYRAASPPHEEAVLVMDQSWLDSVFNVEYGKDVSRLEPGTGADVSAETNGFRGARRLGSVHLESRT